MSLTVIILAAGQGKRMRSSLPKVLHPLAGKPLLSHVVDTARALHPAKICIVYGHGGEQLKAAYADQTDLHWAQQAEQLGTGHAVMQAADQIGDKDSVLILYGDVPLTQTDTLQHLMKSASEKTMGLLTAEFENPTGYGRIIRDSKQHVTAIVEEKDATAAQKKITEINTGMMCVPGKPLKQWLSQLKNDNQQGEYYLTDIIALADKDKIQVQAQVCNNHYEVAGINNRQQLAELERIQQRLIAEDLMTQGVTLADPARLDVRGKVSVGEDVSIDVDVILEGDITLGSGVSIGAFCKIKNAKIGDGALIDAYSHIEDAVVYENCVIGPYARLRPGSVLQEKAKVGNFVEIKKANIGQGSKVNHLSYIGDSELGKDVNVGAGTITCNYDGVNKHKTTVGDGVFIGSNSALVAPVKIGNNATIGAGSTITRDVSEESLALERNKQRTVDGWLSPKMKKQQKDKK